MKPETAIIGGVVATHAGIVPATLVIAGGRVSALLDPGQRPNVDEVIEARDRLDAGRDVAPLRVAEGATVIDSTGRSVDDVVDEIVAVAGR